MILTFNSIGTIGEENLYVFSMVSVCSQQVVEILDVVLVVWERQAPLPTSGYYDRLITDLEQPA